MIESLPCGYSTPEASRTKFYVATINGWESLIVETKISILVALGVLDSPLCEIKMSKLNAQRNRILLKEYFAKIYLKMTRGERFSRLLLQ